MQQEHFNPDWEELDLAEYRSDLSRTIEEMAAARPRRMMATLDDFAPESTGPRRAFPFPDG